MTMINSGLKELSRKGGVNQFKECLPKQAQDWFGLPSSKPVNSEIFFMNICRQLPFIFELVEDYVGRLNSYTDLNSLQIIFRWIGCLIVIRDMAQDKGNFIFLKGTRFLHRNFEAIRDFIILFFRSALHCDVLIKNEIFSCPLFVFINSQLKQLFFDRILAYDRYRGWCKLVHSWERSILWFTTYFQIFSRRSPFVVSVASGCLLPVLAQHSKPKCWPNVVLMLAHHQLRRWANIKTTYSVSLEHLIVRRKRHLPSQQTRGIELMLF